MAEVHGHAKGARGAQGHPSPGPPLPSLHCPLAFCLHRHRRRQWPRRCLAARRCAGLHPRACPGCGCRDPPWSIPASGSGVWQSRLRPRDDPRSARRDPLRGPPRRVSRMASPCPVRAPKRARAYRPRAVRSAGAGEEEEPAPAVPGRGWVRPTAARRAMDPGAAVRDRRTLPSSRRPDRLGVWASSRPRV